MAFLFGGKKRVAICALLLACCGIAFWQRGPLLAWYHVNQLAGADEASQETWVNRVAGLDEAAIPRLIAGLESQDEQACGNLSAALTELARRWEPDDPRALRLCEAFSARFSQLSRFGKNCALHVTVAVLRRCEGAVSVQMSREAGDLLLAAKPAPELRFATLVLAGALIERVPQGQWHDVCRGLAEEGLIDPEARIRVAAINLVWRGPMRKDVGLLEKTMPLLKDRDAQVRVAALSALGSARDAVADDDLLPMLHDADVHVQQTCELVLASRGLSEEQIRLARMISDPTPTGRMQVLQHLRHTTEIDPAVWLRRLSQDPVAAVRAAAVRAAVQQKHVDLRDRLAEMTLSDPSPTVRELAGHYLGRAKKSPRTD